MTTTAAQATGGERVGGLLQLIDELPTIPDTLIRIWRVVDDPLSTCDALGEVVRTDVPLSAKVLRVVNSPYYSRGGQAVADISAAVTVLGFETIKHLAICISVATNLMREASRRRATADYQALWGHSVFAGVVARRLARLTGDANPEEAFTAGLLHDLGKFAMMCAYPQAYERVLRLRREQSRPLVEIETEILGYDHAIAGHAFGEAWHFPPLLSEPARRHHERFLGAGPLARLDRLCLVVALADRLANRLDPPRSDLGFDAAAAETGPLLAKLDLAPAAIDELAPELRAELRQVREYLDVR